MSLTRPIRLPNISNVGENQTATVGLMTGSHTYESVNIGLKDIKRSEITNIDMRVNGKPIQSFKKINDLDVINTYYNATPPADDIKIQFFRKHFTSAAQARTFNLGMADVSTCDLQFDIKSKEGTGSPAATAYAPRYTHVDANGIINKDANRLGAITKVRHFTHATSIDGRFEISDLPREMFLQALHLKAPTTAGGACSIKDVKLELNGQVVWDLSEKEMRNFLLDNERKPNAEYYHLDFMLSNETGSQLSLAGLSDFRLILDIENGGAGSKVVVYPEYWSGIGGI